MNRRKIRYPVISLSIAFVSFACNANGDPCQRVINTIGIEFVFIPAGEFQMGSNDKYRGMYEDIHAEKILKGMYISTTEITQEQWMRIMKWNKSNFAGHKLPVETVTWYEAVEFCDALSKREGVSYRLPTEAEWEYACRAGTKTQFTFGDVIGKKEANFDYSPQFLGTTTEVGRYPPNRFGLYDMHGNVWEWCMDTYKPYIQNEKDNSWKSMVGKDSRVIRGGAWNVRMDGCRSARRLWMGADERDYAVGFRIVKDIP